MRPEPLRLSGPLSSAPRRFSNRTYMLIRETIPSMGDSDPPGPWRSGVESGAGPSGRGPLLASPGHASVPDRAAVAAGGVHDRFRRADDAVGHRHQRRDGARGRADLRRVPAATDTPIKHVVVIMQENRTFDHMFGTFPGADGAAFGLGRRRPAPADPSDRAARARHPALLAVRQRRLEPRQDGRLQSERPRRQVRLHPTVEGRRAQLLGVGAATTCWPTTSSRPSGARPMRTTCS